MAQPPFPRLVAASIAGQTANARYRQGQFHSLHSSLTQHIPEIKSALQTDSGHSPEEISAEIALALRELRTHYTSLNLEDDLEREYRVAKGKDNPDNARGVGIVYIVPSTHTMFYSVVAALTAAVAAGNCVILELPQKTLTLPSLLRKILPEALDKDTFAIAEDRPDASFLSTCLLVSQIETDIPVQPSTLTSPNSKTLAIVDRTADIPSAATSLVAAKFSFGGRSPYAPDLVLVQEFIMRDLVEAILATAPKYVSGPGGQGEERAKAVSISSNPRRTSPGSVLDQAFKDPSARVLVSGSDWGVVEVHDRASPLLKKEKERKSAEKVLILHPVTSLDDAIDFGNEFGPLTATHAFAAPDSAKYLTQFIDAHISFVNHLPVDLLLGPAVPVNTFPPENLETRYAVNWFRVPRPQYISPSENANLVQTFLRPSSSSSSASVSGKDAAMKEVSRVWNECVSPLPPTNQKSGPRIGFFEQGILTGGVITLASFVGVVSTLGWYTVQFCRRV